MLRLEYDDTKALIEWASARIGLPFRPDATAIGQRRDDGTLAAVVVYDGFSECDCNIHVASDGSGRWLTRALLVAAFTHPFGEWGLRRLTGLVPASNRYAMRLNRHLGFEVEGLCRHALPDDDIIVFGMLREHCRYIAKEYRHA